MPLSTPHGRIASGLHETFGEAVGLSTGWQPEPYTLPMNRPTPGPSQEGNSQACLDIDSPPPEGLGVGSWSQCAMLESWRLPMNQEEHSTSNIQHRTSNAEHRMAARILAHFSVRCSMLDVRCFPSVQGFQRANFHFGETFHESPPRSGVSAERRWLLFPRIAALCRDAATPGFMAPMRALAKSCRGDSHFSPRHRQAGKFDTKP